MLTAGESALVVSPDGRTLTWQRNAIPLFTLPSDGFALGSVGSLDPDLSYDPYWLERPDDPLAGSPPADLLFEDVTAVEVRRINATALELRHTFSDGTQTLLSLTVDAPDRVAGTWRVTQPGQRSVVAMMRLRGRADATEGFYGLGEWPDDVNHRGKLRPMQMEADLAVESANSENHVVVPLLIGTRGWGLYVPSMRVGAFDVARKDATLVEVTYGTAEESSTTGLPFYFLSAPHPLDITRHYHQLSGVPTLPAPWAYGPFIWRDENRDQAQFLDDVAQIRALDLATSAMWIDRPYATAVNTFDFNATQFPDPTSLLERAHAAGLRVGLWHVPYLERSAQPYLQQAQDMGFLTPSPGTLLNGWGVPLDVTNVAARTWWQGLLGNYTRAGFEGFKLDYAEDVLPSLYHSRSPWTFGDGSTERTMHHRYTVEYQRMYADLLGADGGFLLCRAGRFGTQAFGRIIWPGDLDATFTRYKERFTPVGSSNQVTGVGGLPTAIMFALNLGPSGFPFFASDTGGYRHSPPNKELFIRWMQHTAFSAVMQVGDSSAQTPWEFTADNGRDTQALDLYRLYARLHLRLFPYVWSLAHALAQTGHAILRPMGLAYPELGSHPWDQYLLGPDLLVAPVVVEGQTSRMVTFPPGTWFNFWTGQPTVGPTTEAVDAPLETLPLFVREGAILPMLRPTIDTLSPATDVDVDSYANDAGRLYVRLAPGSAAGSLTLFDGAVVETATVDGAWRVTVRDGSTFRAGVMLEVTPRAAPGSVMLDGAALMMVASVAALEGVESGWAYEAGDGGRLWVKAPGGMHVVDVR